MGVEGNGDVARPQVAVRYIEESGVVEVEIDGVKHHVGLPSFVELAGAEVGALFNFDVGEDGARLHRVGIEFRQPRLFRFDLPPGHPQGPPQEMAAPAGPGPRLLLPRRR